MDSIQKAISAEFWYLFVVYCNICAFLVWPYNWLQRPRLKRRPHGCLACPKMVHRMFRHLCGCNGHCKSFQCVQDSCTKVNKEVGCSPVAQMRQKGGTRIAVVAEWMHNGQKMFAALCKRRLHLKKLLNKQMSCWLSETLWSSCDVTVMHGSGDITWKIPESRSFGQLIWLFLWPVVGYMIDVNIEIRNNGLEWTVNIEITNNDLE